MGLPKPELSLWYVRNDITWRVHNSDLYTTENISLRPGEPVVLFACKFANLVITDHRDRPEPEFYWFDIVVRGNVRRLSSTFQGWYDDLIEEDRWRAEPQAHG